MKRKLCVMYVIIALIIFSGCTKKELNYTVTENNGIKTFHNKNIPSDLNFKISPKELFTLYGADENEKDSTRMIIKIGAIDVDSKGNLFILDRRRATVKKFDKNGNLIKSFGRLGSGPGESSNAFSMVILNDSIIIDDYDAFRMLKFDNDGNFIRNFTIKTSAMPERFKRFGKNRIVGYQGYDEMLTDGYYSSYNFTLMDNELRKVKEIHQNRIKYEESTYNFFDIFLSAYALSDNEIFFAIKSDTKYLIKAYDQNGEYKYSITKNYSRQTFNKTELNDFGAKYKDVWYFKNNKSIYKSAIVQMEYDKYGNLWVFTSIKRDEKNQHDLLVDIFKDGIFVNSIKLDICPGFDFVNYDHQIRLIGDRLYYTNSIEQYVKVYEY